MRIEENIILLCSYLVQYYCHKTSLKCSTKIPLKKIIADIRKEVKQTWKVEIPVSSFQDPKQLAAIINNEIYSKVGSKIKDPDVKNYFKTVILCLKDVNNKKRYEKLKKLYIKVNKKVFVKEQPTYKKKDIEKIVNEMRKIVSSQFKEKDFVLSVDQRKQLKKRNMFLYQKYVNLARELMNALNQAIIDIFSKSSKNTMTVEEINEILHKKYGIPQILVNTKKISIDINRDLYITANGKKMAKYPPIYGAEIVFNQEYDPDKDDNYFLKFRMKGASVWQFVYSVDNIAKKGTEKYKLIHDVLEKIDEYRKKWMRDFRSGKGLIKTLGYACELIYLTASRVGTRGNKTKGEETYGLLTIKVKHVEIRATRMIIKFKGKDLGDFKYIIDRKPLIDYMKVLIKDKDSDDYVFDFYPQKINEYIRKRLGMNITIHKFRTLRGTKIAYEKLIKSKIWLKEKDKKKLKEYYIQVMTEIGKELGHFSGKKVTYTTAMKNYVDPHIQLEYFEKCGIDPPIALLRIAKQMSKK